MAALLYTLIGDLVASRRLADRGAAQASLSAALADLDRWVPVVQRFEATVADEFQGGCASLADAVRAALLVRLTLLPVVDVRCGLGYGAVSVHDAHHVPVLQDGPGWWTARSAVDALDEGRASRRTRFEGPGARRVNAYLTCRDQLVDQLNVRGRRMLLLALQGRSQRDIAEAEGVWPSAVSQQFARGVGAVVDAEQEFASGEAAREEEG